MVTLYHRKEDCCGCTACANICPGGAIVMQPDEEGFLYPRINADLCVDCGACLAVCPLQNPVQLRDRLAEPEVYALKHKSDNIRMTSASGGAFTAFPSSANDNQPAAVYGAAFDKDNLLLPTKGQAPKKNGMGLKVPRPERSATFAVRQT